MQCTLMYSYCLFETETCFPPWNELKKRCYLVMESSTRRWKDAFAKCLNLGSQMVTISSEEENQFIGKLVKVSFIRLHITSENYISLRASDAPQINPLKEHQWHKWAPQLMIMNFVHAFTLLMPYFQT